MSEKSTKQATSTIFMRSFISSQSLDQRISRSIDVQSLLNPLKVKDHINVDSASNTISEKTTDSSDSTISHVFTLSLTRSFSSRELSLKFTHSQSQDYQCAETIKSMSSQLTFQSDSLNTQYSVYNSIKHSEFIIALFTAFTNQLQCFLSNLFTSSDFSSTMSQTTFDTRAQYSTITLQNFIDVQIESKVASEKRKRNVIAFHRYRQRRNEKKREIFQNISKLEQ